MKDLVHMSPHALSTNADIGTHPFLTSAYSEQ